MSDQSATHTFISFVRRGLATAISGTAGTGITGANATGPSVNGALLPVRLQVNDRETVEVNIQLYGPGDVIGIDPRVVIRTDPPHLATGFEPNHFPAIDFDLPDFPWLFTPVDTSDQRRLHPWICLVVVPRSNAQLDHDTNRPSLPTLTCPLSELPDLSEAWAWAHAQVTGASSGEGLEQMLTGNPDLNLSRLVCPRKLEANKQYYAGLVPTFEAGVLAGLGKPLTSQPLQPAWIRPAANGPGETTTDSNITLPVYYYWEFSTGTAGDFESLARLLKPGDDLPADVGLRPLDVSTPGLGLSAASDNPIGLEGALRTPRTQSTNWPDEHGLHFREELAALLNRAEASLDEPGSLSSQPSAGADLGPTVTPPIYGRWYAAERILSDSSPAWLYELNLDPRHRAAAGFGARVVQEQQEQLMASAWEQLGEIERANQLLRQAQLARAAGLSIYNRCLTPLAKQRPDLLLQITGSVHTRTRIGEFTLHQVLKESALSLNAVSSAFRRMVRPRGPIVRRLLPPGQRQADNLVGRLATREILPAAKRDFPAGMVSVDTVPGRLRFSDTTPDAIRVVSKIPPSFPFALDRFKPAVLRHQISVMQAAGIFEPPPRSALQIENICSQLLSQLDPRITIRDRIRLRIRRTQGTAEQEDPLERITVHPQFPQPMFEALRDLSQDLVLPGLELVPANRVALLEPNPRFIEAYMVGLNHALGQELLWRGFPTDQTATYFRQFWDVQARVPPPESAVTIEDIPPVHDWRNHLGENGVGANAKTLIVLLVRAELVHRYPDTMLYAVKAEWNGTQRKLGTEERHPLFRGRLDPDVAFLGFDLSLEQARGGENPPDDPGWYFVVQQHPTEPRFKFDSANGPTFAGAYLSVANGWMNQAISDSAQMASLMLEQPVRSAIHARSMLKGLGD